MARLKILHLCILAVLAFAAGGADARGLTGTYVARGDHQAFILQIVDAGSQLTGRYEQFAAKPDGKFEDAAFAFTGIVDGNTFAGTLKSPSSDGAAVPVSGDLRGETLRLEGNESFRLIMKRGDLADFQAAVSDLKVASHAVQRAAYLIDLIARMKTFEERLRQATAPLPGLEARLVSDSLKMKQELDRERGILGNGQRSVARGQISVGIHQIAVAAAQTRGSVDASLEELHPASERLVSEAQLARLECSLAGGANSLPSPCPRFLIEDASLKRSIEDGKAAFARFDDTWDRENAVQQILLKASDDAVN